MKSFNNFMRFTGTLLILLTVITQSFAQQDKSKRPSPPAQVNGTIDGVAITIDYSQPAVKGRQIWGELEAYDKVWRAGANEATWMDFASDVKINGKDLPKGKYAFFIIPRENKDWTLIFNSVWNQWGAYNYDASKNVLKVDVKPTETAHTERLTYSIEGNNVVLKWAKTAIQFTVSK